MGFSKSCQRSSMPVSRSASSIPQRRICTVWLNTSRHLVLPLGSVLLSRHFSHSERSSRIPASLPSEEHAAFDGLVRAFPFGVALEEVLIGRNVVNIPFAHPLQANGFDSLPKLVDAACDLNHQDRFRLKASHGAADAGFVALEVLLQRGQLRTQARHLLSVSGNVGLACREAISFGWRDGFAWGNTRSGREVAISGSSLFSHIASGFCALLRLASGGLSTVPASAW